MKRKHAIIGVALIALAAVGYGPVTKLALQARGGKSSGKPLSCDFNGRSYGFEEKRRADDGCNVCTCGQNGWSCTEIACVAGVGFGSISGPLSYPSEPIPAQRVCAIDLKEDNEYCQQTLPKALTYAISAPAGEYWVYATTDGDKPPDAGAASGKRAYFSEFILCGEKPECRDHTPVKVVVEAEKIAEAKPQDWSAVGQIDTISISPSRYEYNTNNYYPGSVFRIESRGLSKAEFFSTPYPSGEGAPFSLIGEAALMSEEHGVQTWSLPIPEGFQAWYVRARGASENEEFLLSRNVWLVRPIVTAAASSTIQ